MDQHSLVVPFPLNCPWPNCGEDDMDKLRFVQFFEDQPDDCVVKCLTCNSTYSPIEELRLVMDEGTDSQRIGLD